VDNLEKLRELTKNLPPVPKLEDFKSEQEKSTEYMLEVGTCISYNLLSRSEASVALTFISSGGKFPEHQHSEKEFAVIISGSMIVYKGDKKETLGVGGCMVFNEGQSHRVRALEDVWLIAVTVPQSKDFPNSKNML